MQRATWKSFLVALAFVGWPIVATAQSQFTGLVRDESGGALPGVTVEAASPALIEKARTVVTDGTGRYTIVDLRPGTYKLTFTLTGFSSAVRDAVELPASFVATINVELKVGSMEETVTVSGQTPVVDVQQAAKTVVLGRDLIDALPTTRSIQSVGQMIPGVRLSVPDVGGERILEPPEMRTHGVGGEDQSMIVDGMSVLAADGGALPYMNDQLEAEVSVRTSAIPAEISAGGVNINSIPKDGGNIFTGAVFLGGSDGSWQADNRTPELAARGLSSANKIAHISIFSAAIGGPIKRNRAWFFVAARHADTDEIVADMPPEVTVTAAQLNRPFSDWCSGGHCGPFGLRAGDVERTQVASYLRDAMVRLSIQVTTNNKFAVLFDRSWKDKDNELSFGVDPVFASTIRDNREGLYPWGYAKWTTVLSSRLMLEGGWAMSVYAKTSGRQKPFNDLPRYLPSGQVNPDWIGNARRQDTALNKNPFCTLPNGCLVWWTAGAKSQAINARYPVTGAMSYVTGSHSIKVGFQWTFGPDRTHTDRQADLIERYTNGVPQSVQVYNTPMYVNAHYDALGIYLQDTWTLKRLTLNPGVRIESLTGRMNAIAVPAGRFVSARYFPEQDNLPNWKNDWAPRVSLGYDVFGTGKTAIKASLSKYYDQGGRSNFANAYAAAAAVNEVRNWFDVDLIPGTSTRSGIAKPTDNDGIAQDSEIGPGSTTFGQRAERQFDPAIQRTSSTEVTVGVNHQVFRQVAVGGTFYRRTFQNLVSADRVNITDADYTSFQTKMPDFSNDPTLVGVLDPNEILTIYNLNPAKRGDFALIRDRNGSNQSVYTGFEASFTARFPGGSSVYGGWTTERNLSKFCDNNDNPNGGTSANQFDGTAVNGGRFCDEGAFSVPFLSDLKMAGNMALPFGVSFGAIFQNYPGTARIITWQPAASVFPTPPGRTNTETIVLSQPGSVYQPRYNQVDINFKKSFRAGTKLFTGQFDLFNVTNSASILTTTDVIGSSLGGVESILKGRMPRIAFQFKF